MANHKSPEKSLKKDRKRHLQVVSSRTGVRRNIKKVEKALAEGNLEEAKTLLPKVNSFISRAAHRNILHKNQADRQIGRLYRLVDQAEKKSE